MPDSHMSETLDGRRVCRVDGLLDASTVSTFRQTLAGVVSASLTRDDILDAIRLFGRPTRASSTRLSWENKADFFDAKNITIPFAIGCLSE